MGKDKSEENSIEDVIEDNIVGPKIEPDPVDMELDRQRAMLTRTDRELLFGKKSYDSEQGLRNAKYRIREHIRNSIDDVRLINTSLPQSEWRQIENKQNQLYREGESMSPSFAAPAVEFGLRFGYIQAMVTDEHTFEDVVEELVRSSVRTIFTTFEQNSLVENVDVDVSVEKTGLEDNQLLTELVFGNPSMNKLIWYLGRGDSDPERLRKMLQKHNTQIKTENAGTINPEGGLYEELVSKYSTSGSTEED